MNLPLNVVSLRHDEFGEEQFKISKASYNVIEISHDLFEFTIYFETNGSIKRVKELEEAISDPNPHFEATAILDSSSKELFDGKIIEQKESWDYHREENLSNVYYFEHSNLEDLKIEISKCDNQKINARLTGRTLINGSFGNNPDTSVETGLVYFIKDENLERSVM